jgi:hypothetical protein
MYQYGGFTWIEAACVVRDNGQIRIVLLEPEEFALIPLNQISSHEVNLTGTDYWTLNITFPSTNLGPRIGMMDWSVLGENSQTSKRTPTRN